MIPHLFFKALGNFNRLNIVNLLIDNGRMSVGEIVKNLDINQPSVSVHLTILQEANIVRPDRIITDGKHRMYMLVDVEALSRMIEIAEIFL